VTTAEFNDTNPFGIKFQGPKNVTSYVLGHQPKSFDWRARGARRIRGSAYRTTCSRLRASS